MEGYAILMGIFGLLIVLFGLDIRVSKNPFIPRMYHKPTKEEQKYVGSVTMFVGCAPILSGFLAILTGNTIVSICSLFLGLILAFILGIKRFKPKEKK